MSETIGLVNPQFQSAVSELDPLTMPADSEG